MNFRDYPPDPEFYPDDDEVTPLAFSLHPLEQQPAEVTPLAFSVYDDELDAVRRSRSGEVRASRHSSTRMETRRRERWEREVSRLTRHTTRTRRTALIAVGATAIAAALIPAAFHNTSTNAEVSLVSNGRGANHFGASSNSAAVNRQVARGNSNTRSNNNNNTRGNTHGTGQQAAAGGGIGTALPDCTSIAPVFGRMFGDLPAATFPRADIDGLATASLAEHEAEFTPENQVDDEENGDVGIGGFTAGYTYTGQFIDHDITLGNEGDLSGTLDPATITNQRTAAFDLDSVFGGGPTASPQLYAADGVHLLVGNPEAGAGATDTEASDHPRDANGTAIIGDPRNDENRIVASLHTIMVRFFNLQVDLIREQNPDFTASQLFEAARDQTRWHYQWAVFKDFLPTVAGPDVVNSVIPSLDISQAAPDLQFFNPCTMAMPVEFSVAAYRFGHSMVRAIYRINDAQVGRFEVFDQSFDPATSLVGFQPPAPDMAVDWSFFFPIDGVQQIGHPQLAYKMDNSLVASLGLLPLPAAGDGVTNLASRNLLRGEQLGLASGQDIARAMGAPVLRDDQILVGKAIPPTVNPDGTVTRDYTQLTNISPDFAGDTPLWTYIFAEAMNQAFNISDGDIQGTQVRPMTLGPVGGRIVAEVFAGMLETDRTSVLFQPGFTPNPLFTAASGGTFGMAQLIAAATGQNVALGATALAATSPTAATTAAPQLTDGDLAGAGVPVATDTTTFVNLGASVDLKRIRLSWSGDPGTAQVTVAVGDGETFNTVASGAASVLTEVVGQLGSARQIRVMVSGAPASLMLTEVAAFRQESMTQSTTNPIP